MTPEEQEAADVAEASAYADGGPSVSRKAVGRLLDRLEAAEASRHCTPAYTASSITAADESVTVNDATDWPVGAFRVVIDPQLSSAEVAYVSSRNGNQLLFAQRGVGGTSAAAHLAASIVAVY